MIIIIFIHHKW